MEMASDEGENKNQEDVGLRAQQASAASSATKRSQGADPNLIRVFDEFGRELFISKEQWRTNVLPGTLKTNWNHPDKLYNLIVGSLNDGFFADVLTAAKHLYSIDPSRARGACIYGVVLIKNNRLDEAESVFRSHMERQGEDGYVLTNLAKVYAARNEPQKVVDTLWRALEIDPNQENGLAWYGSLYSEKSGGRGWSQALVRVAALPGSWRAQIWLAREGLEAKSLETALAHYNQALSRIGDRVPPDVLMQISGDLGKHGYLKESIQLAEPRFVPEVHGLAVGNNLIKAHLDLGQLEDARKILDQLYGLKHPDYKQNLSFWDTEIAKARIARSASPNESQLQISMVTIEGPVWLKSTSTESELFAEKQSDVPIIAFLGSTVEQPQTSGAISRQIADAPGRISRALSLFLAEQVWFRTNAGVRTLVPFVISEPRGFMLSGVPWQDQEAAKYSLQDTVGVGFVVVTHIRCATATWSIDMRVIRSGDHEVLAKLSASFEAGKPEDAIPDLAERLVSSLSVVTSTQIQKPSQMYSVPAGAQFPFYLLRLEQLLATRLAAMKGTGSTFLNGEREILDGNIQLCVDCPDNVGTRILLAKTALAMKIVRPELMQEFHDKIILLNRKKPLSEPAKGALERMFNEAFA
jgi:tetratricopeptide (TPR) repeat protein